MSTVVKRYAVGLVASVALFAGSVRADTTITNGQTATVTDPATWSAGAGAVTINNGGTLYFVPANQGAYSIGNAFILGGSGGTIYMRFQKNDTEYTLGGPVTSTASGAQILAISTGVNNNGDREAVTFNSGIPNVGDGSALSLSVTYSTQSVAASWVNLNAVNTFTGPITLASTNANPGYLTIGGKWDRNGNTSGSGTLNSGNFPGAISLGASTILNYASSAPQVLSGVISGTGALQVSGSGTLTLSGVNTHTSTTTVNSGGTLVLGSSGGLKFVVTNASNNKITGGGTATLNGSFTVDTTAVSDISGSWTLVDVAAKSFGGTFNLAGFTGPVGNVYTKVVGAQTWTFNKASGVLSLSSGAIITSLGIPGSAGVINQVTKTIALTVPYGTSLATLAPTFTLTSGSCNQTSGSAPSPTFATTNPAHYIVTDGAVVNDYAVTVSITAASSAKDILTCDFGVLGAAVVSANTITLTVPNGTVVTGLMPTFTLSPGAIISPASGSPQIFTGPVTYTVTAQDLSTKTYTVTVQTYTAWSYSASLFLLTTPDGANLPAGASESNFPVLVRLNSNTFTFSQAQSDGRDIRFTTAAGASLPYQIEQWDALNGQAAVWVKIPTITGNSRQEIKMYWGKSGVASESNGAAVFNTANGYVSVIHMNESVSDVVGSVTPVDTGTTLATGMIGKGRNFTTGKGINCGETLTTLPSGNTPHSTQAWFRSNAVNCEIVDWGVEGGANKVQIRLMSPPRIYIDSNGPSVNGVSTLALGQWYHVVHTYTSGASKIYINGQLDATAGVTMSLPTVSRLWLGGWYNSYSYAGDMDEVRLSNVARSANWIKLEYENQKALQTLVGNPVQSGSAFAVTPTTAAIDEGTSTTLNAQAGGAQKVYWIEKKNGVDTVIATDVFSLNVAAGRVTGNQSYVIQFKAIYPSTSSTIDVPVTITENLPDPVFTLTGPSTWDGRQTITVTPDISNLSAMQAKGVATLNYIWSVTGVAVTKQTTAGTLTLQRAQGSGPLTVTLVMDNGGTLVTNTKTITVQQPVSDAWVQRTPGATEKPVTGQFFARDDTGYGKIYYNGTQSGSPSSVYLKVYTTDAGDVPYGAPLRQSLVGGAYAFTAPIAAGMVTYKVVYGTTSGGVDTDVATVSNLICGDAYIIEGQSNAEATAPGAEASPYTSPWIRTYNGGWVNAVRAGTNWIGYWGMDLAIQLMTDYNMPICIMNGAVGGTRIDQHQANPADHYAAGSLYSIYANLVTRVAAAKLTHGIRGVLWQALPNF